MSVKKEDRGNLSTSDLLKLSNAAREGGVDKFSFFEADGKIGSDFKAVYDLHMRIEALSKTVTFYDMKDVFRILPEDTIEALEYQFQLMFTCQADLDGLEDRLRTDGTNADLLTDQRLAQLAL